MKYYNYPDPRGTEVAEDVDSKNISDFAPGGGGHSGRVLYSGTVSGTPTAITELTEDDVLALPGFNIYINDKLVPWDHVEYVDGSEGWGFIFANEDRESAMIEVSGHNIYAAAMGLADAKLEIVDAGMRFCMVPGRYRLNADRIEVRYNIYTLNILANKGIGLGLCVNGGGGNSAVSAYAPISISRTADGLNSYFAADIKIPGSNISSWVIDSEDGSIKGEASMS